MKDDNPYRFTGEVEAPAPLPQLPIFGLRLVAHYRRLLFAATVAYYAAWIPLTFFRAELFLWVRDDFVFPIAWLGLFAIFVLAAIAMPWVSPRWGFFKVVGMLVPALNVAILAYIHYRSRRRLERQGVRLGWIVDDFSQATFDPPSPDPSGTRATSA